MHASCLTQVCEQSIFDTFGLWQYGVSGPRVPTQRPSPMYLYTCCKPQAKPKHQKEINASTKKISKQWSCIILRLWIWGWGGTMHPNQISLKSDIFKIMSNIVNCICYKQISIWLVNSQLFRMLSSIFMVLNPISLKKRLKTIKKQKRKIEQKNIWSGPMVFSLISFNSPRIVILHRGPARQRDWD